jgi:hypothetical protein
MYHIRQRNSHAYLLLTRALFNTLVKAYGIFPRIKDLLLYMGRRSVEEEVSPPRLQASLSSRGLREVAYLMRYVELNGNEDALSPWSLRQFLVYNKPEATLWLFVSMPAFAQKAFDEYYSLRPGSQARQDFDAHYILLRKAIKSWRPYLIHLSKAIDSHVSALVTCSFGTTY